MSELESDMKAIFKSFVVLTFALSFWTVNNFFSLSTVSSASSADQQVLPASDLNWVFEETFDGDPSEPVQNLLPTSLDYVATHRTHPSTPDGINADGSYGTYLADHGIDCSPPGSQHTTSTAHRTDGTVIDKSFFLCKNHMMSSMGDVEGYSVTAFYPKMEFDFSNGGVISFDVNINDNHPRSWWEILITPRDEMKFGAAQDFYPIDETYPKDRIVLTFDPNSKRSIQVGTGKIPPEGVVVQASDWREWKNIDSNDPALTDRSIRRNHLVEISNNKISWKVQKQDGTYDEYAADIPGGLPFSKGIVMIKTHAYTPEKDGNNNLYTYHWDNLKVAAGVSSKWKVYESSKVVNLAANGSVPIGTTATQTLNISEIGDNPVLTGQINSGLKGQVLLSINGSSDFSINMFDVTCAAQGWSSFRLPLDPSLLKAGDNTFTWKVGPRPSCATWEWDGFSAKNIEIQFDDDIGSIPPPPPPEPEDTAAPVVSNLQPSGTLQAGTTTATIAAKTNESAVCKYSTQNVDYASMLNYFDTFDNINHTKSMLGLVDGQSYTFYVRCQDLSTNKNTNSTSSIISFNIDNSPVSPPPPAAENNQFLGEFFSDISLGNKVYSEVVNEINYDFGYGSPDPSIPVENFSARWTGNYDFEEGTYKFTTTTDDGVRLYIDDQLVIDHWQLQYVTSYIYEINLTAGTHKIVMEFFEGPVTAVAKLNWEKVEPIQVENFFTGYFYDGKNFGSYKTMASEIYNINYNWGNGSPYASLLGNNSFSIRWVGNFDFVEGEYNFTTVSDDGVRLYIDGNVIIDDWNVHREKTNTSNTTLTSGVHEIVLEYFEGTGKSLVSLNWSKF